MQASAKKRKPAATKVGGAQRAFVRLKTLGTKGMPDLKRVGEQFRTERSARSPDYLRAVAMAATLARLRKIGVMTSRSHFGLNSKGVRKKVLKDMQVALWQQTKGDSDESRLLSLSDQIMKRGLTMAEALSMARSATRFEAAQARASRAGEMQSLQEFREKSGAQKLNDLLRDAPALSAFKFQPEPLGGCDVFSMSARSADDVAQTLAWAHQASKATNLSAALEQCWDQLHHTIGKDPSLDLPSGGVVAPPSACYDAGICLCTGDGPKLKLIGDLFLRLMKKVFAKGSGVREMLSAGRIVVLITGEPDTDDYETILGMDAAFGQVLFHLGLQYFSPFRPTFMEVHEVEAGEEAPASGGRRYVKATLAEGPGLFYPLRSACRLCGFSKPGNQHELHLVQAWKVSAHARIRKVCNTKGKQRYLVVLRGDEQARRLREVVGHLVCAGGDHEADWQVSGQHGADRTVAAMPRANPVLSTAEGQAGHVEVPTGPETPTD